MSVFVRLVAVTILLVSAVCLVWSPKADATVMCQTWLPSCVNDCPGNYGPAGPACTSSSDTSGNTFQTLGIQSVSCQSAPCPPKVQCNPLSNCTSVFHPTSILIQMAYTYRDCNRFVRVMYRFECCFPPS